MELSCGMLLWGMWDLSSLTRDWTYVPCISKWILNHWITREVWVSGLMFKLVIHFVNSFNLSYILFSCYKFFASIQILPWCYKKFFRCFHTTHCAAWFKKHLKDKTVFYLESGGCYSIKQLHGAAYAESKWLWLLIWEGASEKSWGWLSLQVVSWWDPHIVVSIQVQETGFVCVSRKRETFQAQFTQVKITRDFWKTRMLFFF